MVFKNRILLKRIIILIFIAFSLLISGVTIIVFNSSMNMDKQHIRVISLSAEIDNEMFKARDLLRTDSTIQNQLGTSLDTIKVGLKELNDIFSAEFTKINDIDLIDFSKEYEGLLTKLSKLEELIFYENSSIESSKSLLLTVYSDFNLSYKQFGRYLQKYIFDNTILYKRKIFIVFIVNVLFILLAVYFIIRLINQLIIFDRKLIQNTIEIENRERQRIAADLHDGLGAYLSSMIMYIQVLQKDYEENLPLIKKITFIGQLSRQALDSVEEVINNLNPSSLPRFGLVKTLQNTILKVNSLNKTQFSIDSSKLLVKLDLGTEIVLYRICMELINNALKHSNAEKARFVLDNSRKKINLFYEDNGIGFQIEESIYKNNQTGLYNLSKRVKAVDGDYKISSEPGKGTSVKIYLNLN